MKNEIENILLLLREALTILTYSPEKQIAFNRPGCVSCDLLNDFDHAFKTISTYNILTDEQKRILNQINDIMDSMTEEDYKCFDNSVLERPKWNEIRKLSIISIESFHWEIKNFKEPMEIEPDVWKRPPLEQ